MSILHRSLGATRAREPRYGRRGLVPRVPAPPTIDRWASERRDDRWRCTRCPAVRRNPRARSKYAQFEFIRGWWLCCLRLQMDPRPRSGPKWTRRTMPRSLRPTAHPQPVDV
ncbi:hypothetical protein BS78_06G174300 [Paspalum vaginatum]|nr:hypothetical protein BS78_06G174300 [Paspalum vaginatum]